MAAGIADLYVEQGSTFSRTITLKDSLDAPINLTGYTARGAIRTGATSPTVVAEFTMTISAPLTGVILMSIPADETALIPTTGEKFDKVAKYVYDAEIEIGGAVTRILNGSVTVSPEVTK